MLTLFIPLIMSTRGNSGSQATSLIIRALALGEVKLADCGESLGVIDFIRIAVSCTITASTGY